MEDYKIRFIKEFKELNERRIKLEKMLVKYRSGTLDFTPTCPIHLLERQLYVMELYEDILRKRAFLEGVDL